MGPLIHRRSVLLGGAGLAGACVAGSTSLDVAIETFKIWPDGPPGGEAVTVSEEIIERSTDPSAPDRAVIHVRTPTLKVFQPARPNGAAVLICPGGGYQRVVLDKEGDETAMRLAEVGITAAVLIYRLPQDGWTAGWQAPLQDAQRAMRMLRSGQAAKGVDLHRVGVLGFSAGGHLAAALTLMGTEAGGVASSRVDPGSAAPDFGALIYAAYLDGSGSPALVLGDAGPAPDLVTLISADTPPVFLVHAEDDATVPVEGSRRMYAALQAKGVPSELHVFPDGGHGFGIARARDKQAEAWPDLFLAWMRKAGFLR
jgi:acetyl esterase/lipase